MAYTPVIVPVTRERECSPKMEHCDPIKTCDAYNVCEFTGQWDCSKYESIKETETYVCIGLIVLMVLFLVVLIKS